MRSMNGGPPEPLTDGASIDSVVTVMEDDLLQATSMSMLMVNTTVSGSHSHTCRAELVVSPAPDNITARSQTMISIVGKLIHNTCTISDGHLTVLLQDIVFYYNY
jgi:hypothetical protein